MSKPHNTERFEIRMDAKTKRLLETMATKDLVAQAHLVRRLIREEAERRGVKA